jgi:hypothetical protein
MAAIGAVERGRWMQDERRERERIDRATTGDLLRAFAERTDRKPPATTVWTVRVMLGAFVAVAAFATFLMAFVVEIFVLSVVARPDRLPPIVLVPVLLIAAIVTAVAVRAIVRRMRRMLGPIA